MKTRTFQVMQLRFILLFLVVGASAYTGRRKEFCSKAKSIILPFWSVDDLGKIMDGLMADLYKETPLLTCADNFMGYIISGTPSFRYKKLTGIMSNNNKCLENAGSSSKSMEVLSKAGRIIALKLKKAYKKIMSKIKKMKANNKSKDKVYAKCYKMSKAILTKKLVQDIVTACAQGLSCVEWSCAEKNINDLLSINKFNTTRTKAC